MSLKSIFSDFCNQLNDVELISKNFACLQTDEERFELSYNLFKNYASDLQFENIGKNAVKSRKVRERGNERFGKHFDWEALRFYSESIALAPNDSEELALALGNRAACLLHLNLPSNALKDIENALTIPTHPHFKTKILQRREKCLNLIQVGNVRVIDFEEGKVPSLTRGKNSYFDSASSVVELRENEQMGRHLVVIDDMKTGEVLIIEKPLSSILLPDSFYTHCAHCFKRSANLIPCPLCSTSMFCSAECMTYSQKKNHKIECKILEALVRLKAWRMELLSLRILIEKSQQGSSLEKLAKEISEHSNNNNATCYNSADHINVYNLMGNTDKRSVADLFYRSIVVSVMIVILKRLSPFFDSTSDSFKVFAGGLLLRYMQSLPCNAHEVSEFSDKGLTEIGAGVYSTLSLINHSCEPNVVRHSYGDVTVLRSIRPIKNGEEILDNYGYHYATHAVTDRQCSLLKQYYFECSCEACNHAWPQYENINDKNPVFKETVDVISYKSLTEGFKGNLENVFKGSFSKKTIESFCLYLDFLDRHVQRPWKNYNKCQEAIKHCLSFEANCFMVSKGLPDHCE